MKQTQAFNSPQKTIHILLCLQSTLTCLWLMHLILTKVLHFCSHAIMEDQTRYLLMYSNVVRIYVVYIMRVYTNV